MIGLYGNDDFHNGILQSLGAGRQIKGMIQNFTNKVRLTRFVWEFLKSNRFFVVDWTIEDGYSHEGADVWYGGNIWETSVQSNWTEDIAG